MAQRVSEPITFLASIPPLMSAVQVAGDGGLRLKLDVPDSEIDILGALLAMRGEVLRVTVEIDDGRPQADRNQSG
jgi:hypothetical protein